MSELADAAILLLLLIGGSALGVRVGPVLSDHHRSPEAADLIRLVVTTLMTSDRLRQLWLERAAQPLVLYDDLLGCAVDRLGDLRDPQLDTPFSGAFLASSRPMRDALTEMSR